MNDGDEWSMEVDLRSREKEKRTLHWFVRGKQQKGFIDRVEFGVFKSFISFFLFDVLLFVFLLIQVSVYWPNDRIEFVRLEELDSPSVVRGMEGEEGMEW